MSEVSPATDPQPTPSQNEKRDLAVRRALNTIRKELGVAVAIVTDCTDQDRMEHGAQCGPHVAYAGPYTAVRGAVANASQVAWPKLGWGIVDLGLNEDPDDDDGDGWKRGAPVE